MAANGHSTKPGAGWALPKYEVQVKSERFKFNAAHFVAFPGYRERPVSYTHLTLPTTD